MPISIQIGNKSYDYPIDGEDPSWGANATDVIVAIADILNTIQAPGDINTTTAAINNNILSYTNINGLNFDPTQVRSGIVSYAIYRISTEHPAGNAESGSLYMIYDNSAAVGSKWSLAQTKDGEAGVIFSITDAGQFQYQSTSIDSGSGGYVGTIRFSATTIFP